MDSRNFANGTEIPSEGYCDQPYMLETDDGAWLCVMTTGAGHEGQSGQHVITLRSTDRGRTWQDKADVEPATGPEASWAVLLKTPFGRIYCFYTYNGANLREVRRTPGAGTTKRVDTLGDYVLKYSDDHGRSWSAERYTIPVRAFECDLENPYGGEVRFFWNVGRPFVRDKRAYVPLHKVGQFGEGFMARSEGAFVVSDNLLTERDPAQLNWLTLPDGQVGLRPPAGASGRVADEQHTVVLEDGALYCTYRGIEGYAMASYSRDGGHTWEAPHFAEFAPGGRRIKNPRACPAMWKLGPGRYLRWFHLNSTRTYNNGPNAGSRNIVWLSGGVEEAGAIRWSQPEIGVYVDGQLAGASYPDLVEEDGQYTLTATQKTEARVWQLDPTLLEDLFRQHEVRDVTADGLALALAEAECGSGTAHAAPAIPALAGAIRSQTLPLDGRGGLTLDFVVRLADLEPGQVLADTRSPAGIGYAVTTSDRGTLRFEMCDGWNGAFWDCDAGIVRANTEHHVTIIVDGGPKAILFVVDGVLRDGGEERDLGFGRFNATVKDISGGPDLRVAPALHGTLRRLRVYARALRVTEAIGNWRADGGR